MKLKQNFQGRVCHDQKGSCKALTQMKTENQGSTELQAAGDAEYQTAPQYDHALIRNQWHVKHHWGLERPQALPRMLSEPVITFKYTVPVYHSYLSHLSKSKSIATGKIKSSNKSGQLWVPICNRGIGAWTLTLIYKRAATTANYLISCFWPADSNAPATDVKHRIVQSHLHIPQRTGFYSGGSAAKA